MDAIDAFRQEHAALLEHVDHLRDVARRLPGMETADRAAALRQVLGFLRGTLIPHAEAEERVLYPAVAALLGRPEATATMISDHRAIVSRIEALEGTGPDEIDKLQELLYGTYALLLVHFYKEESDYLPLLEDRPPEETAAIFERMSEHSNEHAH
jgi:iron-sulfur cluster repair protein YtfE (RIC family)